MIPPAQKQRPSSGHYPGGCTSSSRFPYVVFLPYPPRPLTFSPCPHHSAFPSAPTLFLFFSELHLLPLIHLFICIFLILLHLLSESSSSYIFSFSSLSFSFLILSVFSNFLFTLLFYHLLVLILPRLITLILLFSFILFQPLLLLFLHLFFLLFSFYTSILNLCSF